MHPIFITYNPNVNGHSRQLSDEDLKDMKAWLETTEQLKDNPFAIVIEDHERPEKAHIHVPAYIDQAVITGRQKSQELRRWFDSVKETLPERWRYGTAAFHVKAMTGKQTPEETLAGYLEKGQHEVYFSKGFDEEELQEARERHSARCVSKKENLVETTYMEKALEYRKAKGLETTRLAEVLAHMCNNGFSINYLSRKRKITQDEVYLFAKQCEGELTADDIEECLFADPTPKPIDSKLVSKLNCVFKTNHLEKFN